LLSPFVDQKLVAFKVTAANDTIKLKDLALTGTNLDAVSNIRLVDSSMNVLGTASNVTSTSAKFVNLDNAAGSSIAVDKSPVYYVVADINSTTDVNGVSVSVLVADSTIRVSNGDVLPIE